MRAGAFLTYAAGVSSIRRGSQLQAEVISLQINPIENYNIFYTCEVTARVPFGATGLRSVSERSGPQVGPTLMHPLNVGPSNSDFI